MPDDGLTTADRQKIHELLMEQVNQDVQRIVRASEEEIELATAIVLAWCQNGRITEETPAAHPYVEAALYLAEHMRRGFALRRGKAHEAARLVRAKAGLL